MKENQIDKQEMKRCPDNYLEMLSWHPDSAEAVVVNGVSYTYGKIIQLAKQKQSTLPKQTKRCLYSIRERGILNQLISFLACQGTSCIPVLVPYDSPDEIVSDGVEIPENAVMAVMTSGTTGVPKILFRNVESWAAYFPVQNEIFGISRKSRMFAQGSLAFTGNLNLYMSVLYAGGCVVAEDAFEPRRWEQVIREQMVDTVYLIPSKMLLLPRIYKEKNDRVTMLLSGSQSLGKSDAKRLKDCFPNTHIVLYYGASELNYITYVTDENMTKQRNLIGKPFPGVNVWIEKKTDDADKAETGQIGEFYIDTPYHIEGITMPYSLKDVGYQDEAGNFYFAGRSDDILNVRGRKVSALKIENAIEQVEGVRKAAVIKVTGHRDEVLAAFVEADEEDKELLSKLRGQLAHYEMPKIVKYVAALPKNESGKVDKKRLIMQV